MNLRHEFNVQMARLASVESPLGSAMKKRQHLAALALVINHSAREVLGVESNHLAMTRTISKHLFE